MVQRRPTPPLRLQMLKLMLLRRRMLSLLLLMHLQTLLRPTTPLLWLLMQPRTLRKMPAPMRRRHLLP